MRIAVLTGAFPSVSETFVLGQVTGLLERGHDVTVFAAEPPPGHAIHGDVDRWDLLRRRRVRPEPPAGAFARVAGLAGLALTDYLGRWGLLARTLGRRRLGPEAAGLRLPWEAVPHLPEDVRRFDACVAHFGPVGQRALRLRRLGLLDAPVLTIFHGFDITARVRERGEDCYRNLFADGDMFAAISERWRDRLVELGCPEDRLVVHHMGIDLERFRFRPRTRAPGEPLRLLTVGRLVEKKGVRYAIEAVRLLRERGESLRWTVVGDGPLRGDLEAAAAGLGDTVEFTGAVTQEEVALRLADAHLSVLPSVTAANGDQEGIPVTLMEALATGCPVVSTRHSGIPELVEDGVSGRLVPERDAGALADAIADLAADPEGWETMGRAGRERVAAEFDLDRLNDLLVERLRALAAGGRGAPATRPPVH